jgi:hypothetical protein
MKTSTLFQRNMHHKSKSSPELNAPQASLAQRKVKGLQLQGFALHLDPLAFTADLTSSFRCWELRHPPTFMPKHPFGNHGHSLSLLLYHYSCLFDDPGHKANREMEGGSDAYPSFETTVQLLHAHYKITVCKVALLSASPIAKQGSLALQSRQQWVRCTPAPGGPSSSFAPCALQRRWD